MGEIAAMAMKQAGWMIGPRICKVFGLDADVVHTLDLHIGPSEAPTVTLTLFPTPEQIDDLEHLIAEYQLVPRSENGRG